METVELTLVVIGAASIVAAVIGGGVKAWGFELPTVSGKRLWLLGFVGSAFLLLGIGLNEGLFAGSSEKDDYAALERELAEGAARLREIDFSREGVQLETVSANGRTLTYVRRLPYRLEEYEYDIVADLEERMPRLVCDDLELSSLIDRGATIAYVYIDDNARDVTTIAIDRC